MKLQKRIIWTTLIITILALFLFIAFSTFWKEGNVNDIFSNISIGIFGSALLVFIPAVITFHKNKSEAKQKIISELSRVENLVNDVHFQTTFLKDFDGQYTLDFSFEKNKYELAKDFPLYTAQKDIYDINSKRVEMLYNTIRTIDHYDYSFFDAYLDDYVSIFGNEKLIHILSDKYFEILHNFMVSNFPMPYGYGVRQYEFSNATTGQFFDIWFKNFLVKLEPIDKKLEDLRTILIIMRLRFYKSFYDDAVNSDEHEKKLELKKYIEQLFNDNHIKKPRYIIELLDKLK